MGLCSQWCIQRRPLWKPWSQGCPLGAAGALLSGPQLNCGPCSSAANLQPTHMAGPAPTHSQGGPGARAGAALVPPLGCPTPDWGSGRGPGCQALPWWISLGSSCCCAPAWVSTCSPSNTQLTVAQHNCSSTYKPGYLSLLGFTVMAVNVMPLKQGMSQIKALHGKSCLTCRAPSPICTVDTPPSPGCFCTRSISSEHRTSGAGGYHTATRLTDVPPGGYSTAAAPGPTPLPKQAHLVIYPGGAHQLAAPTGCSDLFLTPPVIHKLGATKTEQMENHCQNCAYFLMFNLLIAQKTNEALEEVSGVKQYS